LAYLAVLALAGAVSVSASGRADDEKVTGDLKKMQGAWVKTEGEGPDARWVFEGDTLKAKVGDNDYVCKVTLDPKASPHPTADLLVKEGPGDIVGKTSKAIYKFDGDKLVFCVTHAGVDNRPTDFKPAENESFLFEFKKEG
jgi:uncharacterized protein (TIGR03067 family)